MISVASCAIGPAIPLRFLRDGAILKPNVTSPRPFNTKPEKLEVRADKGRDGLERFVVRANYLTKRTTAW